MELNPVPACPLCFAPLRGRRSRTRYVITDAGRAYLAENREVTRA